MKLQSHNAMENWGLITYRTTAILFDDEYSDAKYKNRVAYVVAHGMISNLILLLKICLLSLFRARTSMVWKSCDYGLVE